MTTDSGLAVIIPARDEEQTVGAVVHAVLSHDSVTSVVVIDNGSVDATARAAHAAGARVVSEPRRGLGHAMKKGIGTVESQLVLRTDADISNWSRDWIDPLLAHRDCALARAVFTSPYDEFPVTRLVVRPMLEAFVPALASVPTPISGTYLFRPDLVDWRHLPDDWSWDIALLVRAHELGFRVADVHVGELRDKPRSISHYEPMARDIQMYFLEKHAGMELRGRP